MILPGPSHDAQRDGSLEEQTAWKGDGAPQLPMVRGVIRRASTTEDEAVIAKVRESLRTDMRRGFLIPVEVAEQLGLPIGGAWVLSGPAQQGSVDVCVCVCVQCPEAVSPMGCVKSGLAGVGQVGVVVYGGGGGVWCGEVWRWWW